MGLSRRPISEHSPEITQLLRTLDPGKVEASYGLPARRWECVQGAASGYQSSCVHWAGLGSGGVVGNPGTCVPLCLSKWSPV